MSVSIQAPEQFLSQTLRNKLPAKTVAALLLYPQIAAELVPVLNQPPFSAEYVPREIEVLFDDVTVVLWKDGQIQQQLPAISSDYQPDLIEWVIDNETAFFSIQGMTVINRIQAMPLLDIDVLESLKEELCKQP
ncbi:MAG: hypothetical protein AAGF01_00125 [Cyanobacteria bacterium P01_G01_bin.38]